MNIYFSTYKAIQEIERYFAFQSIDVHRTGWGYHIDTLYHAIKTYGPTYDMYLVDSAEDADIEFCPATPQCKMLPNMTPNCYYTMSETTGLPKLWVDCLNTWNLCLNPSQWGTDCFQKLLSVPTEWIGFIHDVEKYPYIERNINGDWYYLAMGLGFTDRKNLNMVMECFMYNQFPSDAKLTVKLTPRAGEPNQFTNNESIAILYGHLPVENLNALYAMSHVSVNPSRGEGVGLIVAEGGLTGQIPIVSNFSALTEFEHTLKISGDVVESPYIIQGGNDFEPNSESLLKQMIWTYENREKAMEMGRLASESYRKQFNPISFLERLHSVFEQVIKHKQKKILEVPTPNFSEESMILG